MSREKAVIMPRIDEFLREMVSLGASDLHMLPGFPPLLRLRGDLEPTERDTLSAETNEQLFFEIHRKIKGKGVFNVSEAVSQAL